MPLPQPPRDDPLEAAVIAWADASARLAAALRHTDLSAPSHGPHLTLAASRPARYGAAFAVLAACYFWWSRLHGCACQWHLAFEVHPIFHAGNWSGAVGASILWQLWDGLKPLRTQ